MNGQIPSLIISTNTEVIIDPSTGGFCSVKGHIKVEEGGKLTVKPGKVLSIIKE